MAVTVTATKKGVFGDLKYFLGTVLGDSSYPTGGEALTASDFGFPTSVVFVDPIPSTGYVPEYDYTNSKLIVYRSAGLTPAGTNSVPTSTKPTFTVAASGAIGTNMEVGLSVDTAGATFEGGVGITAERILTTTSPVGTPTIGAPTFTGTAVAAAALVEVSNAVDLSLITFRVFALGY